MTRLKVSLTALALALSALSCATNTNTNTAIGNNGTRTVTVNAASPGNSPAPAAAGGDLTAARATYDAACVKCHKENGEGGMVEMDKDKLRVPSFKGGHALKHSDEEYARQISEGGEGMPAFKKRLTPEQITGLVRLIRAEFQAGAGGGTSNANSAHE
jgi:mono/diheme cytochrome c family protein